MQGSENQSRDGARLRVGGNTTPLLPACCLSLSFTTLAVAAIDVAMSAFVVTRSTAT
jgi:hypothetical protein